MGTVRAASAGGTPGRDGILIPPALSPVNVDEHAVTVQLSGLQLYSLLQAQPTGVDGAPRPVPLQCLLKQELDPAQRLGAGAAGGLPFVL